MFKKVLQIAVSFSLLLGGYAGYTRLFLIATALLGEGLEDGSVPFPEIDAKSALKATMLARESFGPDFWASQDNLKLNYNEEQRGYYIYSQNYELLNDRKQLKVWPFALVWVSADGKSHKTATSDVAIFDMSQPFGTLKPGAESSHITHARLIGNVRIRDDKGTRDDPTDDLRISQLDQVDYDEATLQITSDSELLLEDRNLWLTGIKMMIQLRRKEAFVNPNAPPVSGGGGGGPGFDAETIFVYKDVHVVTANAGSNGVLPGTAKPEKTGNTPIDTRSDGEMRIDLPKPHPPVLVGPPDLNRKADPTFVKFNRNVRVMRGTDKTDQQNSDTLDLTLTPKPKPPENVAGADRDKLEETPVLSIIAASTTLFPKDPKTKAEASPKGSSGPMTDLQLTKAIARGDAVWLQSEAQGLKVRCIEMIHEKHYDGTPDTTYLNGGESRKLWVERIEFDTKSTVPGTIKSILVMKAQDATIFDFGPGGTSRVIARGPGRADERPSRNSPIKRTAYWGDEMDLITWRDGEGVRPTPHVEAAVSLAAAEKDPTIAAPPKGTLRRVITLTGVSKLVDHGTPTDKEPGQTTTLDARKSIVAEFQAGPKLDPKGPDGPNEIKWLDAYQDAHLTSPSRVLTARKFLQAKFETMPAPSLPAAPAAGPGPIFTASAPEDKPDPAPTTPEPAVDARADRVWANILLGSAGAKSELKNARLRGGVMVHQDPAVGKTFANEAFGEAIDLTGQGKGLMKFAVKAEEPPQAFDPRTKLASASTGRRAGQVNLARVEFEGKVIESENLIGLDQKGNFAWVEGAGVYTQLTDRGLLDDKGIAGEKPGPKGGPTPQDKMVIYWNDRMWFIGNSKDLDGRPAAKIEFRGVSKQVRTPSGKTEFRRGVDARMTESRIVADSMDVYMDRTIDLAKDTRKSAPKTGEPAQPDPQIAMLDCKGQHVYENGKLKIPGVEVINEKLIPGTKDLKEKQRIQGVWIIYDKRSGEFEAPGPGTTWLYQRDAKSNQLKLTKVRYVEGMQGRFGAPRDQANDDQHREAIFDGSAQSANATVLSGNGDIDFDSAKVAKDWVFLTSDRIHVFSYPPPLGSKAATRQLLNARGNGIARTPDSLITADRITYDSSTELMYAYGDDDKEVGLTKQESPGQPFSTGRGKMLRYNKATRASDFTDPQAIVFTDLTSGFRPKAYFPELGGSPKPFDPPKQQRLPFMRSQRSGTERKQFTGS